MYVSYGNLQLTASGISKSKIMTDRTLVNFNRWLRISVGLFFGGVAIYYKEWIPAIFGAMFILQGILNRGCHGECYVAPVKKQK